MDLSTIGYEGLMQQQLLNCLVKNGIEVLVDVRELPLSRKPGFSKTNLSIEVQMLGIDYIHIPSLGCPKEIRHEYKRDGNWQKYTLQFLDYLETQSEELEKLAKLACEKACCLLCFEADPNYCHRYFVAAHVKSLMDDPTKIIHLRYTATGRTGVHQLAGDRSHRQLTIDQETCVLFP